MIPALREAIATAALGTATGLRSSVGFAAVITGTPRSRLPRPLSQAKARPVAWSLVLAELTADKLPFIPSRTEPAGLAPRILFGGGSAAVLARSAGAQVAPAAAIGAGSALGSAFAGHAARGFLSQRMPALVVALIEDTLAVVLAYTAVRSARRTA